MKTLLINRFDGGIASDPRTTASNEASMVKHFDIFTYPHRLVPYGGIQSDQTTETAVGALLVGSDGIIYGVGDDTSNANPGLQKIFKKANTGPTSAWSALANSLSGKTVNYKCFVEYKDYFYTLDANRYVMRFDRTGSASSSTTYSDLTSFTNAANGFVHPKDDVLYIPYDNKIWALNGHGGTPTVAGLTLPSNRKIIALTYWGNYLAIATVPTTGGTISQNSVVYLWDRDTTSSLVTETIDWGNGYLKILKNLNGVLVGISTGGAQSATARNRDSLQCKVWNGGAPELVVEATSDNAAIDELVSFVNNDRVYFSANLGPTAGTTNATGLWAFGKNKEGRYALSCERLATTDASDYLYRPYCGVVSNGYATIGFGASYGNLYVTTSTTTDFSVPSTWESTINPNMPELDRVKKKQLVAVSCHFAPLATAAQVVLKYKVDGGSWTTINTYTTDGGTSFEMPVDADGTQFTAGWEYEFQVISTGGAEITGVAYKYEVLETLL